MQRELIIVCIELQTTSRLNSHLNALTKQEGREAETINTNR